MSEEEAQARVTKASEHWAKVHWRWEVAVKKFNEVSMRRDKAWELVVKVKAQKDKAWEKHSEAFERLPSFNKRNSNDR